MSSARISKRINYKKINAVAFSQFEALVGQWLPGGKLEGHDYVVLNPTRKDNNLGSFRVDMRKGSYKDFATGDGGKDPVSLFAYLFHGNNQGAAAKELAEILNVGAADVKPTPAKKLTAEWAVMVPPLDAPEPPKARPFRGLPEDVACYQSAEGAVLGYVYRFKTSDGGKETIPLTWCKNLETGQAKWHWKAFDVPRYLYGLNRLASHKDATVLIVEGERCANVAAKHMPDLTCVTWPGGSKAVDKANWEPLAGRKVIIWPDCDAQCDKAGVMLPEEKQPGMSAANKIGAKLVTLGCRVWLVDIPKPGAKKSGWDIADAVEEGLTGEDLSKYVNENLRDIIMVDDTVASKESDLEQSEETDHGTFNVPSLPGTDARDGTKNTRPLSELGNACRLYDNYKEKVKYVHDAKAFLIWRGGAWQWDVEGAFTRGLAAKLPKQIYAEGVHHLRDAEEFAEWSRKSQKERTIKAAVSLLQDFECMRLPLALVDKDNLCVGIANATCVIDLRTGESRPAKRGDFITKSLDVDYLGEPQKAERWLKFLNQVFNDDAELVDWVKRWCGYLLTGSTSEQIFVFCFGLGANGKSVFADTVRYILGDYARAIASETLTETKRQAGGATPDLAELIGARLALSSETEDGAALAESLIKSLVSGDTITVRKLYASPVQFTPQFKMMILGNHRPIIRGVDYGIWRRIRMIPFNRTFSPEERDRLLLDRLKAEAQHILAWMVEGCLSWQKKGLHDVPATIRAATGDYQVEQDLIGRWISEACNLVAEAETPSKDLYKNYSGWCFDNGLRPASNIALGRKLSERGFGCKRSNGNSIWAGLAIAQPALQETVSPSMYD